ncbi:MAG: conjugal transfer protein TraR [Ignavibacteriae bacterium]|nr:conjugal transfer protein TraR [Ignavibacteriota bacterium]
MKKKVQKTKQKPKKAAAKPKKTASGKSKAVKKGAVSKSKVLKAKKTVKAKAAPKPKKTVKVKKAAPVKKQAVKAPEPKKKLKRKSGKTRYTPAELQHFKEILLNERRDILESAKANMKSLVDDESGDYVGENLTYSTHMAEQGTDEMEREKNYMFVQRDEKYLGYIQEALTRIDQGTYGLCIDCIEEPKYLCNTCPLIPRERLELVPITQHCIECKNLRG